MTAYIHTYIVRCFGAEVDVIICFLERQAEIKLQLELDIYDIFSLFFVSRDLLSNRGLAL